MSREDRAIFTVALTLFIYAFASLLQLGSFIFPIPVNNLILLVVGTLFFFWNKEQGFAALLIFLIGLLSTLGTSYYWSTFLPDESMRSLSESMITDVFMLSAYFCIILFAISSSLRQKTWISLALASAFGVLFIYGQVYDELIFVVLSYAVMIISNIHKAVFQPLHLIWILLFILEGSKLATLLLA